MVSTKKENGTYRVTGERFRDKTKANEKIIEIDSKGAAEKNAAAVKKAKLTATVEKSV